jgi:hypothetical protein
MIEDRLSTDQVGTFLEHLEAAGGENPELTTSPFLLSLIIEVLKKKGVAPRKLVELYEKQVEGIMSRCIQRRKNDGLEFANFRVGDLATDAAALKVATDYLETLAFVCQILLCLAASCTVRLFGHECASYF